MPEIPPQKRVSTMPGAHDQKGRQAASEDFNAYEAWYWTAVGWGSPAAQDALARFERCQQRAKDKA